MDENPITDTCLFNSDSLVEVPIVKEEEEDITLTADLAAATEAMTTWNTPARGGGRGRSRRRRRGRPGRPRKYNYDESNANPTVPHSPKRGRRKNALLASIGGVESTTPSDNHFTSHVITIYPGQNVGEKIMSFCGDQLADHRAVVILSATGMISSVTLRRFTSPGHISYEGRFHIMSLTGSLVKSETESSDRMAGRLDLRVSLVLRDTSITGGSVIGPLIAATPIRVVIGTFVPSEPTPIPLQIQMPSESQDLHMNITEASSSNFDASASCSKYNENQ